MSGECASRDPEQRARCIGFTSPPRRLTTSATAIAPSSPPSLQATDNNPGGPTPGLVGARRKWESESVALIDFGTPIVAGFPLHHRRRVRHGGVSVSRCTLPPNPGIALGTPQFTVAIHDDRPFDMEWRLPESRRIERQRIVAGQAHINGPDRPIFQRWSASPAILVIALEPDFVRQIEMELFDRRGGYLPTRMGVSDPAVEAIGNAWRQELMEAGAGGRLFAESMGTLLTVHLFRTYGDSVVRLDQMKGGLGAPRLRRLVDYIEAHLEDDVSLRDLAAVAGMSVHYFGEAFKATMGIPPHRYLIERRILRSKELLLDRNRTIASIAFEVGFSSHSHFTLNFRKATGMTPTQFRRNAFDPPSTMD